MASTYTDNKKNDAIDQCDKELDCAMRIIFDMREILLEEHVDGEEVTEALNGVEQSIENLRFELVKKRTMVEPIDELDRIDWKINGQLHNRLIDIAIDLEEEVATANYEPFFKPQEDAVEKALYSLQKTISEFRKVKEAAALDLEKQVEAHCEKVIENWNARMREREQLSQNQTEAEA